MNRLIQMAAAARWRLLISAAAHQVQVLIAHQVLID
jgi:hypothetical protein